MKEKVQPELQFVGWETFLQTLGHLEIQTNPAPVITGPEYLDPRFLVQKNWSPDY